jgi:hypothetical protein
MKGASTSFAPVSLGDHTPVSLALADSAFSRGLLESGFLIESCSAHDLLGAL